MSQQPPSQNQQPQSPQQPSNQGQMGQQSPKKSKPIFKRTPVIVALIATGGPIIVALIGGIFLIASKGPTPTPTPTPPPPITVTSNPTPMSTPTPTPAVMITYPKDGSKVGSSITVKGTASNIPAGKELWLFVTEETISGYWPQGDGQPIMISSGGTWSVEGVSIGKPNDPLAVGKTFKLYPVLINQNDTQAHDAIKQYFQHPDRGISRTSGMQLLPEITVTRV